MKEVTKRKRDGDNEEKRKDRRKGSYKPKEMELRREGCSI